MLRRYKIVFWTFFLAQIFSIVAYAESSAVPVQLEGELEVLIEDDLDLKEHKMRYFFHENGKKPRAVKFKNLSTDKHGHLKSGKVRIRGKQNGSEFEIDQLEELTHDASQSGSGASTQEDAEADPLQCQTSGGQRIVSVLVNLKDHKLPAVHTDEFMKGALLGNGYSKDDVPVNRSVDLFWRQASDNRAWVHPVDTKVIGPIDVSENFNTDSAGAKYCDNYGLRDKVVSMIDPYVDFSKVDRLQIIMPGNGACSWAGTGNVGCRSLSTQEGIVSVSVSWNRAETMLSRDRAIQLTTHEMGHNLGLYHGSTLSFSGEPLGKPGVAGSRVEYGDNFNTMGSWNFGFYAASQIANVLNWFDASDLVTVESSRNVTLRAYEYSTLNSPRAVKIKRGTTGTDWIWIEARKNTSPEFLSAGQFLNGAMIRYQSSSTGSYSELLDFRKATPTFDDGYLGLGETWKDPHTNLEISVVGNTAQTLDLRIIYGGSAPPSLAAPQNLTVK